MKLKSLFFCLLKNYFTNFCNKYTQYKKCWNNRQTVSADMTATFSYGNGNRFPWALKNKAISLVVHNIQGEHCTYLQDGDLLKINIQFWLE